MLHQALELAFGAVGGEIGDLRLEGRDQIGRGIDDGRAEVVDLVRIALQPARKALGLRVQADAQHGAVLALGGGQHLEEGHAGIVGSGACAIPGRQPFKPMGLAWNEPPAPA